MKTRLMASEEELRQLKEQEKLLRDQEEQMKKLHQDVNGIYPPQYLVVDIFRRERS